MQKQILETDSTVKVDKYIGHLPDTLYETMQLLVVQIFLLLSAVKTMLSAGIKTLSIMMRVAHHGHIEL